MASIKINGAVVANEYPFEFVIDGTEEPNYGSLIITNSTQREPYNDWADVDVTINRTVYQAIIQQDISTRIAPNIYEHSITLAEHKMKLKFFPMADRFYTTKDGSVMTYLEQLDNMLLTLELGKDSPFTYDIVTRNLLDTAAVEKEYAGGDLLANLTDMFRSVKAGVTLSKDNVIGHELFGDLENLIEIGDIIGEVITSDVADYGLAVQSKVKNATYEGDAITGGTWFPSRTYGVTPRTEEVSWDDKDAKYFLDGGIRRIIDARLIDITINADPTTDPNLVVELQIGGNVVSKDEWDELEISRSENDLMRYKYKNNTFYFVEGDNKLQNVGTTYRNNTISGLIGSGDSVMEWVIKSAIYASGYGGSTVNTIARYLPQNIKGVEAKYFYQAQRDMDVRVERHDTSRVWRNLTVTSNQKDSKLELNRYGKALKSQINRIGNDKFEVTVRYNDFDTYTIWGLNDYTSDDYKIVKSHFLVRENSLDVSHLFMLNSRLSEIPEGEKLETYSIEVDKVPAEIGHPFNVTSSRYNVLLFPVESFVLKI
jgi:hypothetical protein